MNKINSTRILKYLSPVLLGVGLVTTTAFAAAPDGREWEIERTLRVKPSDTFRLATLVGSITVESHDKNVVEFEGRLTAKNRSEGAKLFPLIEQHVKQEGSRSVFELRWKEGKKPRSYGLGGKHLVRVPYGVAIEIQTAGGKVEVADRDAAVSVVTSGGGVRVGDVEGPASINTSGGGISIGTCHGDASLKTSGGSIKTKDVAGSLSAHTSGGSIKVGTVEGHLSAKTSGGSIHATLENQITQPVSLNTSGGSIHLAVREDFRADLDAKTSGGRVVCDLPLKVAGRFSKKEIHGAVNGGGPKVTMRTSGGSIRLERH